jgi:hypothetical protein
VSSEHESARWSGELEADVGLSAGLDFSALLGFESASDHGDDEDDGSSVDAIDLVDSFGVDGGVVAGFESAIELMDVSEDLNDG